MAAKKSSSPKYRSVNPEDYYNYEDQYLETGGGGSSKKQVGGKGKKTLQSIKREQRVGSLEQRKEELESAICDVLDGFPDFENDDRQIQFLEAYVAWVKENLTRLGPLDPSQIEIGFSKSGGPGGQNINKRETKVALLHGPTGIRVANDQTRSQGKNRELAEELLHKRLEDHLRDWKMYLGPGQEIDRELILEILEKNL